MRKKTKMSDHQAISITDDVLTGLGGATRVESGAGIARSFPRFLSFLPGSPSSPSQSSICSVSSSMDLLLVGWRTLSGKFALVFASTWSSTALIRLRRLSSKWDPYSFSLMRWRKCMMITYKNTASCYAGGNEKTWEERRSPLKYTKAREEEGYNKKSVRRNQEKRKTRFTKDTNEGSVSLRNSRLNTHMA